MTFSPPSPPDRELRLVLRTVAAAVLVVAAGAFAVLSSGDGGDGGTGSDIVNPSDAIGPLPGAPLATYISQRQKALGAAEGNRAAAVSLTRYRTEDSAREVLSGMTIRALLVAGPGGEPAVVKGSLADWADAERAAATAERKELEGMLDTDDPSFQSQFRTDIARLEALVTRLDPAGEIVFGAVVTGSAKRLRALAEAPPVRLVDIGAGSRVPALTRVRGVRPEETVRAGAPPERPL